MTRISRRHFVNGGIAAAAVITRPAHAAEHSLKFGCEPNADHPLVIRMIEAAQKIKNASGGRVEIQVFPSSQLGGSADMLNQVRSGALDMYGIGGVQLGGLVPVAQISSLGFAFPDYKSVWAAMDGDLGVHIEKEIAKSKIISFRRVWDLGYRQITSRDKPILSPEDLHNFKIRVPASPMWTSMFKLLNASPITINFVELYSALQTKIADGQENPIALIESARLQEVQKFCSMTNHCWGGYHMILNPGNFKQLPAKDQELIEATITESALVQREDVLKANQELKSRLEGQGMTFVTPDPAPFRRNLIKAGFYSEWRKRFGEEAWGLLEKYSGPLG